MLMRLLVACVALATSTVAAAQADSILGGKAVQKERYTLFGWGHTNILDTYLSQETYQGTEIRYLSEVFRQRKASRVSTVAGHHVWLSSAGTRNNRNSLLTVMYNMMYGWHYNCNVGLPDLRLKVGGLLDGTLGGTYNTRNSNNPAQARISLSLNPSARLSWDFRVRNIPFTLHYEASLPLIGLAFSPNFGQSYYEIFSEGNYDRNVVVTSPFAAPQLHQMLVLDFQLWRKTFSIGYMGDIRQMKANQLKYHQYTHGVVIGWKY